MKRYTDTTRSGDYEEDECFSEMVVDSDGEYVKYEDVQELLDWMKDKIKEWKNDYNCGPDDVDYYGVGREESAEELEQKLREIGEL